MSEKWNTRMLALAELAASWSKDPKRQVGAVVADTMNRVVSLGFNGLPRGVADCEMTQEEKRSCTIHAEENALLFGGDSVRSAVMFVTHPPCARCAAKIIQAGVFKVVHADRQLGPYWTADLALARRMFAEASVLVETVARPETPREAWLAVTEEATGILLPASQTKGLILTEDLCVRLGASLGL